MGCDVRVAGATDEEARRIRALFDRHQRRFSRFIEGSELNAVNAGAGRAIRVSRGFADMLELSLWAAHQTGGLVDPTVGSALRAAGYDRDFGDGLDRPEPASAARAGSPPAAMSPRAERSTWRCPGAAPCGSSRAALPPAGVAGARGVAREGRSTI